MDPKPTELSAWQALGDVIEWTKMPGQADQETSDIGSFLKLFGAAMEDPINLMGSITVTDFDDLLKSWTPNGTAPSPTQKSRAALVGRGVRIYCGTQLTLEAQKAEDEKTRELEMLKLNAQIASASPTPAVQPQAPVQTTLAVQVQKKVKMNLVADQVIEQEVDIMSEAQVATCYQNYAKIFGGLPPPDEEITVEQMTALHVLLQSGCPPYVDFAVFGPHGHRLLRKLRCTGLQLMPGGDLRNIELAGPPTFGMWERCNNCLKTGLIQLQAVGIAKLLRYHELHKRYSERYGPSVWHIQYQCDVRMRQERMIYWKRVGQEDHRKCQLAGTVSEYDPLQPWDFVWGKACEDFSWWHSEFEEPVLLILTKTQSLSAMIDGDVDLATEPHAKRQKPTSGARQVQQSGWESGFGNNELPTKHNKMERLHNVNGNKFTTNRRGSQLCEGYNAGTCTAADQ